MSVWSQFFPPAPTFTESDIGPQSNRIFIITGGTSGIGLEMASMLYPTGATIYIVGRSKKNGLDAISRIKASHAHSTPPTPSSLHFLYLDLSDLRTVGPAAAEFLRRESRIDVLWNNAGVGATFNGEVDAQGLPVQLGTNCVGPLLFTQLLKPALEKSRGARVVWVASTVVDSQSPRGGMKVVDFERPNVKDGVYNYTASKVGNWFLAVECARREKDRQGKGPVATSSVVELGRDGCARDENELVLHVAVNPGNLKKNVWRTWSWLFVTFLNVFVLYEARYGAYTELWAGLSSELDEEDNGSYVIPWGRRHTSPREDVLVSLKSQDEEGTGIAARFYDWCEKQSEAYR